MVEVNGQQYQHATCKFIAVGTGGVFKLRTVKKIDYDVTAEKKATNNAEGKVDGFTISPAQHTASLSMKLSEYFAFRSWLLANNPGLGVLQCQFDFPVTYGSGINALKTDVLRTCMLQKDMRSSEDNQDALMVDIPLFFLKGSFADGDAIVYED